MEEIYIGVGSAVLGAGLVYLKTRRKYQQVKGLLQNLVAAIEDDRIDEAELRGLIQDAREIIV